MKTQHTPGPWTVRHFPLAGNNSAYVVDKTPDGPRGEFRGQIIAAMTTAPDTLANLRLIAAAPDLLAALKEALVMAYANNLDAKYPLIIAEWEKILTKATA